MRLIRYAVTAAAVATLTASAAPEPPPIMTGVDAAWCVTAATGGLEVSCAIETPPPAPGPAPRPVALATAGRSGCVRGPGRPVVGTTGPALSVTFADPAAEVTFEYQDLGGAETVVASPGEPAVPGRPVVLDNGPDTFGPGESYRWRTRGTPPEATETGWSDWCEFTVAAGLPDLREAENLDAVLELGLLPGRRYAVGLTVRQWRTVLSALRDSAEAGAIVDGGGGQAEAEASRALRAIAASVRRQVGDAGGTPTRRRTVTLTGDEWAGLATDLAGWAAILDQSAAEEDPGTAEDGSATWAVLDLISGRLGGPAHPSLGTR
jgi:hypothetical protein